MAAPVLLEVPDALYRVEFPDPPLRFSTITSQVAAKPDEGNRFDVLGASVLYAATTPGGSYAETLADFRPKASLLAKMATYGAGGPPTGTVPSEWRRKRMISQLRPLDALPFLDIEAPATHTYLTGAMADILDPLKVNNLDVAHVRGPNRLLTRAIATWVYAQTDEEDQPVYGKRSRTGDSLAHAPVAGRGLSRGFGMVPPRLCRYGEDMDDSIPLHGSATASYEKVIRADMMATGSSEVDIAELNITPELWRKTARRAARTLGRPVETLQTQSRLFAALRDWPATDEEKTIQQARLRAAINSIHWPGMNQTASADHHDR